MNILLVGGTGFIGTNLAETLDDRGHSVTAMSRNPEDAQLPDSVERAAGNATNVDDVREHIAGHDAVVNLVALSPLFEPPGNLTHERIHLGATKATIEAAEAEGVSRFIQMSANGADPDGDTAYIRAKGQAEVATRASDLDWTIFRPSVVFGDGGEFIDFALDLAPGPIKPLPGGGRMQFQPIWVGDVTDCIGTALESYEHVGETYAIGGPDVLTLAEITRMAARAKGRSATIVPVPMTLTTLGLHLAEYVPPVPMGADQARSLKRDDVIPDNDVTACGRDVADLRTLGEYLGLDSDAASS